MNRLKTAVYIAILAAYGCSPAENPSEKPIRRDLAEVVYASGNVYTETEYRIFSNVQGYLTEWMVSRSLDEIQELVNPSLFFGQIGKPWHMPNACKNSKSTLWGKSMFS